MVHVKYTDESGYTWDSPQTIEHTVERVLVGEDSLNREPNIDRNVDRNSNFLGLLTAKLVEKNLLTIEELNEVFDEMGLYRVRLEGNHHE